MTTHFFSRVLGLTLAILPLAVAPALAMTQCHSAPAVPSIDALHGLTDPSLGPLRAGRVALTAQERAGLKPAQANGSSLAALRGGFEPTQNEWTWLAIGAVIVLLIVLI